MWEALFQDKNLGGGLYGRRFSNTKILGGCLYGNAVLSCAYL